MHSLNQVLSTWEDVLTQLGRCSVSWRGISLSDRDRQTFTEAIVMAALHLTDLSTLHGGIGPTRELIAWAHFCVTLDVHDIGSFLSDAVETLRHVAAPTTYSWFKRQLSQKYPFVGRFCAPIRKGLSAFLESPNPSGFYASYQFFSFLTHLTLVDIPIDLESEYEELETYLQSLHYPPMLLRDMNNIMREWMKDFSITEETFNPHHGPGAVAELPRTATLVDKYQYLGTDALIDYVFSKHVGVDVTSYYSTYPKPWERCSKLVFVPKSMKTRRCISKEPATLMFLQQGVKTALVDYIHKHSFLSGHIDLRDQDRNADLAVLSSATHQYATIDLSSASDTVTTTLVKAVFRGTPVYPFLVALRSRTVKLPSGKVIGVEKYAPMGSALCFPVETLIFSCAVEVAVRRARAITGFYPLWRVYGDDIIVEDPLFSEVLLVLTQLGFITNTSKSFNSCARFRESCGGEGYDGVDVRPLRISRRFRSIRGRITSRHADTYEGLIDLANACHSYKFSLLRAWIIRVLLDNPIGVPLFSEDPDGALYSPCPDNYRAPVRVNHTYQRTEIKVVKGKTSIIPFKVDIGPDRDTARYIETLRLSRNRLNDVFYPDDRISVPRGSGQVKLRSVWVEDPKRNFACLGLLNSLQAE